MIINANDNSIEFYIEFLNKGGFIQVGTLNNRWIRITNEEMLRRFYDANCLFRVPYNSEEPEIVDWNFDTDLSEEEKEQLEKLR